ncbi:MAG: PIG-L family deacetylase [Nanoarchaeota archaeon]|nr:PIG-L family deacetylase [Nanoarchaeota archaeon]
MKKVLVFAPHPDDEILGCGGILLKRRKEFPEISICYVTYGDTPPAWNISKEEYTKLREIEARKVCKKLNVSNVHFLGEPDGFLKTTESLIKKVVRVIREEKPHRVYIPHDKESNSDHKKVHEIVKEAIWWASFSYFPECLTEIWEVPEIFCYEVWTPMIDFNYVEDITNVMVKKIELLQKYKSQLDIIRYDEAIKGLNRYRGIMSERGYFVEVFNAIKI